MENSYANFQALKKQYQPKTVRINNITWSYYDIGNSQNVIVILPDIMGTCESWFIYLPLLLPTHRVIIPFYPAFSSLEEMTSSLHAFLQSCNIKSFSLIGSSIGGLFAQQYVRKYPNDVEKLLLIATGTADKTFGIILLGLFLGGSLLPEIAIKWFVYLAALFSLSVKHNDRPLWKKYIKEQIWKVNTKKSMFAWGKCILELCWQTTFTPLDLAHWAKPFFLVEANNDFVFNPLTRRHLRSLYPQATLHTIRGANHLIWINRSKEVSDILQKFIL